MNTENAKTNDGNPVRGWIYYDAACCFCVAGRRRWGRVFERRGFVWLPLQTPAAAERTGCTLSEMQAEMKLLLAGGRVVGGVDAWIELFLLVWWLKPAGCLMRLPGLHGVCHTAYLWCARHRYCMGGACGIHPSRVHHRRTIPFCELP